MRRNKGIEMRDRIDIDPKVEMASSSDMDTTFNLTIEKKITGDMKRNMMRMRRNKGNTFTFIFSTSHT